MPEKLTPLATILSPIAAIPIILALVFSLFGCVRLFAATYGIDLASLFPSLHADLNVGAPLILFGASVFALVLINQLFVLKPKDSSEPSRWRYWFIRFCLLMMLIAFLALPYWLELSYPELWAIGIALISWVSYKKLSVAPE